MNRQETDLVRCPICDVDHQVYFTARDDFTAVNTISAAPHDLIGWNTCPLCAGTGQLPKDVCVAFELRFDGVRRVRADALRMLLREIEVAYLESEVDGARRN